MVFSTTAPVYFLFSCLCYFYHMLFCLCLPRTSPSSPQIDKRWVIRPLLQQVCTSASLFPSQVRLGANLVLTCMGHANTLELIRDLEWRLVLVTGEKGLYLVKLLPIYYEKRKKRFQCYKSIQTLKLCLQTESHAPVSYESLN